MGSKRQALRCKAKNRRGEPCKAWAMSGQQVCWSHGGASPQARAAAERRLAVQKAECLVAKLGRWSEADDVHPLETLCDVVRESAANVAVYRLLVQELEHRFVSAGEMQRTGRPGIAGPDHLGDGARHIFVAMYDEERDRLARYSKLALEAGVEQRQIALDEGYGVLIRKVIEATMSWLFDQLRRGARDDQAIEVLSQEVRKQLALELRAAAAPATEADRP